MPPPTRAPCTSSPNSSPHPYPSAHVYLRFVARSVLKLGRAAHRLPPLVDHLPAGPAGAWGAGHGRASESEARGALRSREAPLGLGTRGSPGAAAASKAACERV